MEENIEPENRLQFNPTIKPEIKPEIKSKIDPELSPCSNTSVDQARDGGRNRARDWTQDKPQFNPEIEPEMETEINPEIKDRVWSQSSVWLIIVKLSWKLAQGLETEDQLIFPEAKGENVSGETAKSSKFQCDQCEYVAKSSIQGSQGSYTWRHIVIPATNAILSNIRMGILKITGKQNMKEYISMWLPMNTILQI